MYVSKERVVLSGRSVIAVGARCTDVHANELLVVRGCCVPNVEWCARFYTVRHIHVFALGGSG